MRHLLLLLLLILSGPVRAQSADHDAVRSAAQDYLDALYDARPDLIERSVHPDLSKTGIMSRPGGGTGTMPMSYDQLLALAGRWNVDNRQGIDEDTPNEVIVFDVLDRTASAKVVAQWGVDHMHLLKIDGSWKILNILWQTPPALGQ